MKRESILKFFAKKKVVVILIGQSAAGKNTLAQPLLDTGLFFHSETGQLFRETIPKIKEYHKLRLAKINDQGKRQPWIIASALWVMRNLYGYDGTKPIIIDGSPRSRGESRAIIDFFGTNYMDRPIVVFKLCVADDVAEARMINRNRELKGQGQNVRKDTANKKSRMKKLQFFHTDVVPAINFLRNKGIPVYEIDANVPIEEVRNVFFNMAQQYITKNFL